MSREDFALCSHFFNCLLAKPKKIPLKGVKVLPSCIRKNKPLLYGAKTFQYSLFPPLTVEYCFPWHDDMYECNTGSGSEKHAKRILHF